MRPGEEEEGEAEMSGFAREAALLWAVRRSSVHCRIGWWLFTI
jgi:hypothetical protein